MSFVRFALLAVVILGVLWAARQPDPAEAVTSKLGELFDAIPGVGNDPHNLASSLEHQAREALGLPSSSTGDAPSRRTADDEAIDVYEQYARAMLLQNFERAAQLGVAAAEQTARTRALARRTQGRSGDRVYVAKGLIDKAWLAPGPGQEPDVFAYEYPVAEAIADGSVARIEAIMAVTSQANGNVRQRHHATLMRIDGAWKVSEFSVLPADGVP